MTRKQLFDIMQQNKDFNINKKLEFLENYVLSCEDYSEEQINNIKHILSHIKSEIKHRWEVAHRKEDIFRKNNHDWLQGTIEIPKVITPSGRPPQNVRKVERAKRKMKD